MTVRHLLSGLVAGLLLLSACRKAEVSSYRIPKEKEADATTPAPATADVNTMPAASAPVPTMASTPVTTASGSDLTWTAPAQWTAKAASAMRKATYIMPAVNGATGELSITAFPGDVGGELANLNRWRGQVQLPPISEGDLSAAVTRTEHDGLKIGSVDLVGAGANPSRLLGAWVPYAGATWFFKLTGPDAAVAAQKAAFGEFLASVKPAPSAP